MERSDIPGCATPHAHRPPFSPTLKGSSPRPTPPRRQVAARAQDDHSHQSARVRRHFFEPSRPKHLRASSLRHRPPARAQTRPCAPLQRAHACRTPTPLQLPPKHSSAPARSRSPGSCASSRNPTTKPRPASPPRPSCASARNTGTHPRTPPAARPPVPSTPRPQTHGRMSHPRHPSRASPTPSMISAPPHA